MATDRRKQIRARLGEAGSRTSRVSGSVHQRATRGDWSDEEDLAVELVPLLLQRIELADPPSRDTP